MEGTTLTPIPRLFYSGSGLAAARPAAATLPNGSLWFSTDTLDIDQVVAGAWATIFDYSTLATAVATHDGLASPHSAAGFGKLTVAETEVYNAAAPIAWTDLNLAGVVGANHALVFLKFAGVGVGEAPDMLAVRINGDTDEFFNLNEVGGVFTGDQDRAGEAWYMVLVVLTDASGIIEWICETADVTSVDIIGYIK